MWLSYLLVQRVRALFFPSRSHLRSCIRRTAMKKRNLILGSIALLLVIVGTWGILEIRARTSVRAALGNITAHSIPTDQTSLYKTGTLLIPTVKVSTSTANCYPKHIPGIGSDPAHRIRESPLRPPLSSLPPFTEP